MGQYLNAYLMLGCVGKLKEDHNEVRLRNIADDIDEYFFETNIIYHIYDADYRITSLGEAKEPEYRIMVGYQIGCTNDNLNNFGMDLEQRVERANKMINRKFLAELEENFPEMNWGVIEYRNVITLD